MIHPNCKKGNITSLITVNEHGIRFGLFYVIGKPRRVGRACPKGCTGIQTLDC